MSCGHQNQKQARSSTPEARASFVYARTGACQTLDDIILHSSPAEG